jgi:hypothetical protein
VFMFLLHLSFLVAVLGFSELSMAMGFMVYGKCHHKAPVGS